MDDPYRMRADTMGGALVWIVIVGVLSLLIMYLLLWADATVTVMSPENIKNLSQQANQRYSALSQQAGDIADLEARLASFETLYGADRSVWPHGKRAEYEQIFEQVANRRSAWRTSCAEYEALWADEWRDVPAPDDLPKTCPLLVVR